MRDPKAEVRSLAVAAREQPPRSLPGAPIVIVAMEHSGDLHGAELARALRRRWPDVRLVGLGGAAMREAGVDLWRETVSDSVMGFTEVASSLPRLFALLRETARRVRRVKPAALVIIDAPDFTLRLARLVKRRRQAPPIVAYVLPQIWAWRVGRTRLYARYTDLRLALFPFEPQWFGARGVPTTFIGHPLLDRLAAQRTRQVAAARANGFADPRAHFRARLGIAPDARVVGLLPGSRRATLARHLPPMLEAAHRLRASAPEIDWRFLIAGAPSREPSEYARALGAAPKGTLLVHPKTSAAVMPNAPHDVPRAGEASEVLGASNAAVVCSGTSTIEAALTDAPMVVVYRAAWLSYTIARALVTVRVMAMVNVILGRALVPELLQRACTGPRIAAALEGVLTPEASAAQRAGFAQLRAAFGSAGAPDRAAEAIAALLAERASR